ncbi:MAG: HAD-IIA family hydrolase [Ruminococcaceae bacterium]|nr:HAD-IIA family hydrolase [Oscillospiraceae bacterium]
MNFKNPPISVLEQKRLFVFDMDGTIYLGNRPFPFAIRLIDHLRKNGKKVLFFTNNASHSPKVYLEKLSRLGFSPAREEIMTSGDVTVEYLKRHLPKKSVYLVGTKELEEQFSESGIHLLSGKEGYADIVVTSFDTSLTYEKLNHACRYIRAGAQYLSTHPDYNCPTEDGFIPDSGAISAFVTASTGVKPTYFGKPYTQTVEMICEVTGFKKSEMCFLGDRLYTDIAIGKQNGVTAVLVLSGETQPADLAVAPENQAPDFVFPTLAELDDQLFGKT